MTSGPRERLIASAIELVRRNGVAGTGVAELLAHSNVARRSIYMHFPQGKGELITESTRAAGHLMSAAIASATAEDDPIQALEAFLRMWKHMLVSSDYTAGCPIAAAALAGFDTPTATDVANTVFAEWQSLIATQLRRNGVNLKTARSLAAMMVSSVEGAVLLAIASKTAQPLDRVHTHLNELLKLHLANSSQ